VSLKPYPEYEDSGLQWLDSIPADWAIIKLSQLFQLQRRAVRSIDGTVTAFRDGRVTLRSNRRLDGFTEADKEIGYQGVRPGDLVIHQMDAFAGAIGVSDSAGKSTPVYSVCAPARNVSPYYFAYLLRHLAQTGFIEALARGIRERSTDFRWATAKQVELPGPPPAVQLAIVEFLDRETAEIDAFIADQEELIALLTERRAATISHAVTKGLDLSTPLSKTSSPWFPELPVGWDLIPCRLATTLIQTGPFGSQLHSHEYVQDGVPLVNPMHLVNGEIRPSSSMTVTHEKARELQRHSLHEGDVVVARRGELGRSAVVAKGAEGFLCGTGSAIVRLQNQRFASDYFQAVFSSRQVRDALLQFSVGSTMDNLNTEAIGSLRIPAPPLSEQHIIMKRVRERTDEIDATTADAREAITLSKERRAALISAAVTGKIDVRDHGGVE
jgi:type I restriction enzyme S subunit